MTDVDNAAAATGTERGAAISRFYPIAAPDLGELEAEYVLDAIRSGWVSSLGDYILNLETGFAQFCESKHGIATCNGTTALHLVLEVLGIKPGDEVIVPSLTFVATANAVRYTGATPVFVDVDPETWCIDPACVDRAITKRTRAVIPVHLYGHPADMDALEAVTESRGIVLIEDAAEAHGARYRGSRVGSIGRVGVFSFYGNKIITTGEGGMIVTDDADLASRSRFLRDHAMSADRRYWHTEVGYNSYVGSLRGARGTMWSSAGNALRNVAENGTSSHSRASPMRRSSGTRAGCRGSRNWLMTMLISSESDARWKIVVVMRGAL